MPRKESTLERIIIYGMLVGWFILGGVLHNIVIMLMPLIVFAIASVAFGWKDWSIYKHPNSIQDYNEGVRYLQANDCDKAIKCFDHAISKNPEFAAAYENRAVALLKKNNPYRAVRDLSEAIRLRPNNPSTYFNRALTYFQMGDYDKALADCDQASKLDQTPSVADLVRARILVLQGRIAEAVALLTTALENSPQWTGGYSELADTYARVGNNSQALENYNLAIEIEPRNAELYNNRGYFYSRIGEYSKALQDCNRAISLNPKLVYAFGTRGHTYFLMQKYDEALNEFNRATKLKPDHKLAIVGQALCENALGNKKEAQQIWQSIIQLDPKYNSVEKLVEDYLPAQGFVDAVRKMIIDFNNDTH